MKTADAAISIIKDSVSALQAGEALGLNPDRNGRCACPLHNGRDRNMKLSSDDRGYHCFVCHAGGDVIHLVQAVNHMTFPEALGWLNETFSLGLDLSAKPDRKALDEARRAREKAKAERQRQHEEDMLIFETYADCGRAMGELESDIAAYAPKPGDEHWDSRFVEAVKAMEKLKETSEDLLDILETRKRMRERTRHGNGTETLVDGAAAPGRD